MKNKKRHFILLSTLFLLFWLGIDTNVYAQTPVPPTRESLTKEIQERAQSDVANGKPIESTEGLNALFGEQAKQVGMPVSEVLSIYEKEYNAAKAAKPWWEGWLPNLGWVAAFIALLAAIFRGAIEEAGKKFVTTIGTAIYNRMARYRPFWMFALRKYRQSLEKTYCELKIPFRAGRPFQMQDVYVPVRVEGGSKQQVDAYQTIQGQKRLVVLGDPGSGKTMLLRHVAFTYARQGLDDFQGQPIPVYLELNRVESAGDDLFKALTKTLEDHNFPGAQKFLKSELENQSLLILLDGLDEVNMQARSVLVKQIQDLWQKHPDNRIIVTCRKAVYQGELDAWVDAKLEISEFSDQQIQRFMTSWQKDMPAEKSIEHFFRTLRDRPQIMALARTPLLLTMVAFLYTDTEFVLPHSRSEFYSRSTDLLLDQWHGERNHYKAMHKRIVLQRLALFNQLQAGNERERRTIELIDVLKQICIVAPDLMLKTEDAQPLLDEIVQRSGLMLAIDGGMRYQFTHLTLQEYFAACALEVEPKKLLDSYFENPDTWREVVRLWCSLGQDCTNLIRGVYEVDPLVAFECISDARNIDATYVDQLIENFQPRFKESLENDALAKAFALLAADPRPRGAIWLEILKENLNADDKRLASCNVLAYTNIPQAAEILAKLAATQSDVLPFLIRLGNLAVPALTEPVQRGENWAMDAIFEIGTPQAALVLQSVLWTNEPKAYYAAWQLASLLYSPGIEDALQATTLTVEQRNSKQIEWIWEPFTNSNNVDLRVIVGRIAYLLRSTSQNTSLLKISPLPCDLRLTLPLCALAFQDSLNNKTKDERKNLSKQLYELVDSEVYQIDNKIRARASLFPGRLNLRLDKSRLTATQTRNIVEHFSNKITTDPIWRYLFSMFPVGKRYSLLQILLLEEMQPSVDDWRNLNRPISYSFSTSWHIKVLKLLLLVLAIFIFGGASQQINQSPILGNMIIGLILSLGLLLAQMVKWNMRALDLWGVLCLGTGVAFGSISGEITHNWGIGALVGVMIGIFSIIILSVTTNSFVDSYLGSSQVSTLLGILVSSAVFGAAGGATGDSAGSAVGCVIFLASVTGLTSAIVRSVSQHTINARRQKSRPVLSHYYSATSDAVGGNWNNALGIGLVNFLVIILVSAITGIVNILLIYYPTKLLDSLTGHLFTTFFWFSWMGSFYILYFMAHYFERRAQNPLRGLLEPSGAAVSSQRGRRLWWEQLFGFG